MPQGERPSTLDTRVSTRHGPVFYTPGPPNICRTFHTQLSRLFLLPNHFFPIPTLSGRESIYRSVWFRNDQDNSYLSVSYTVKDERRPEEGGKVRIRGA